MGLSAQDVDALCTQTRKAMLEKVHQMSGTVSGGKDVSEVEVE